jgi:cytochrome P450
MGSKDPLAVFTQWTRDYGDIFYYRAIHRPVYFLNNPEFIKYVLLTNYPNFIKGEALRFNRRIFGKGLLTSEGDFWLQQRRLIQPAFHGDRIASYAATTVTYTQRMLENWQDGASCDIYREMMRVTLEIVSNVLFNLEIQSEQDKFAAALTTLLELSSGPRMLMPPLLRRVPTRGNLRYERSVRQLDEVVFGFIRQRRAHPHPSEDVLNALLEARDEDGNSMPDQQIRDEVMTLLLAGHETTAVTLAWTFYLLAQHPEIETKLFTELQTILSGRAPTKQDLPVLTYTDCILKESMRLYPAIWAVVRNPIADCEIGGYTIPAGASIVMSQWVMHRDPRFYDNPESFQPERWLLNPARLMPKFAYFPFGGGPRTCIGASFATMEMILMLATIVQSYKVRLTPNHPVEPSPTITLRPKHGIQVILEKRSQRNS